MPGYTTTIRRGDFQGGGGGGIGVQPTQQLIKLYKGEKSGGSSRKIFLR